MKRHSLIIALLLVTAAVFNSGCDSQSSGEGDPPRLIPPEAFSIQTDLFSPSNAKTQAKLNFAAAALRVWPVSIILQANLLIPAAVTDAALDAEAVLEDGVWVWSTTSVINSNPITFTLSGDPVDDGVDWSMRITADQPINGQDFDSFELFTAHTSPGGLAGSWQLYYPVGGESRNVLNADYELRSDDDRELTFSIPESADQHAGDWVRYAVDGTTHTFEWHQVGEALEHHVAWDAESKEGYIEATNHNNGIIACWDSQLEDTPCK